MKKLITIILLAVAMSATAQTKVKVDAQGNYIATAASRDTASKPTGKTITASDGKTYPVFISSRGKLYYNRVSRNGNTYKSYLKID